MVSSDMRRSCVVFHHNRREMLEYGPSHFDSAHTCIYLTIGSAEGPDADAGVVAVFGRPAGAGVSASFIGSPGGILMGLS